jgi:hypothetical protein
MNLGAASAPAIRHVYPAVLHLDPTMQIEESVACNYAGMKDNKGITKNRKGSYARELRAKRTLRILASVFT